MRTFAALLVLLLPLAPATSACKRHSPSPSPDPSAPRTLVDLSPSLDPVRTAFNAHKGQPRFVALMSPT